MKGQAGPCPPGRNLSLRGPLFHKKDQMSLSQGNSSSWGLSHMVCRLARIISRCIRCLKIGLLPQENKKNQKLNGESFKYSSNSGEEENQGKANKSCTPFLKFSRPRFWGTVWRDVRLSPSLLGTQLCEQRGNTVLAANTRGKCSTKIQPIAGKEHQAFFSLGSKVCDHTLV